MVLYESAEDFKPAIFYTCSSICLPLSMKTILKKRCAWAGENPLMVQYHDTEWGVPVHDDTKLFEFLVLEGAQAGLAWQTVLNKREEYRRVFKGFNAKKIARFGAIDIKRLLGNPGIIRNRLKIASTIENAKKFLGIQKEFGSFDSYMWQFVSNKFIESNAMSKDLLKRGFTFVGPTICYAFMQAVGMVNDHELHCFRRHKIGMTL